MGFNGDTVGLILQFIQYATEYENAVEGHRKARRNMLLLGGVVTAEVLVLGLTAPSFTVSLGVNQYAWFMGVAGTATTVGFTVAEYREMQSFNETKWEVSQNVLSVTGSLREVNYHSSESVLIVNYD